MLAVRKAVLTDAQTLSTLGSKIFWDTFGPHNAVSDMDLYVNQAFSREQQAKEIPDPKRVIAIIEHDSTPVGFYSLFMGPPETCVKGPKPLELSRFYVDSASHGKQVASTLMEHCLQSAKGLGFETLWLGVWEHNLRAQNFYKKFHFAEVGEHPFILGTDPQRDLIMARTL